ncbi:MAG: hypothetical protein LBT01_07670, partial [Spirochaetaceae bacterium]|nr:hypothetical protein [Spirochaetaceae bacterium]
MHSVKPPTGKGSSSEFGVNRQCWGEVEPSPDNCTRTGEGVYAINLARRSASESRCSEGVISAPRRK